jgi:hypothetical protein
MSSIEGVSMKERANTACTGRLVGTAFLDLVLS